MNSCDSFVLSGLLYTQQEKIREEFKASLGALARKLTFNGDSKLVREPPLFYLLRLLSTRFSQISDYQCKQFFELFCDLIDLYFIVKSVYGADIGSVFDPEQLLSQIIDKIKDYNTLNQSKASGSNNSNGPSATSSEDQESIYIGLIQLTGKIFDNFDIRMSERLVESKNLIDEIFVNFLFASVFAHQRAATEQPKEVVEQQVQKIKPKRLYGEVDKSSSSTSTFLGKKSKDAAYRLLNNLIKKSPLLMKTFLEKSMLPLMGLIKRHDGWNYTPPSNAVESRQKYVGLKNLGCICYMNAMMQQFFMIPAFRYNLLSAEDGVPEELVDYKGQKVDDNMMHQM